MRISYTTALLLLFVPSLFGVSLSFDAAVEQFTAHNYDLQIARQEVDKSKADLSSAHRRPNPTLSGSYDYWDVKHHFNDVSSAAAALATVHLDHPIELGGKRDRRINAAEANIAYAGYSRDEIQRQQLFRLVDTYFQTQADEANLANAIANRHDFEVLQAIGQAKYDHGFLSEIDLEKLQLQSVEYDKEVERYRTGLAADKEALAFLLSIKADAVSLPPVTLPDKLPYSEEELVQYTHQHRSDCLAAQQNVKFANASVELEKANAVPDITIGMESENYAPTYKPLLIGISFSVLLPVYDRNQGGIQKSRITALQASTQQSKVMEQSASEVRQSYLFYQSQQSNYRSMIRGYESAKNLKEKQEKIFALKGISILELLDAQKSYRDYQKNMTQALIDLHIITARLKLNSGFSLMDSK